MGIRRSFWNLAILSCVLVICFLGLGCSGGYYVALNGDDSNAGTREGAFASIEKAIEVAQPGESILIRGGTYYLTDEIEIEKDGMKGKPINLWAYPGEEVVLDFSNAGDSSNGFEIEGSYWHLKGLVIQKAGEKGIHVEGSHNVFERLITRTNGDGGIKLDDGAANNLVVNCDSYLNYDKPTHGTNADGFQAKHGLGKRNVFKGCRAWNNSDDGFDFMEAGNAIRVEDCWAWSNGVDIWKDPDFGGNGVGFKLGEKDGAHVIIRCLVWKNGRTGFNIEENTSSVTMYHNTAWKNPRNY
ncbi:MAG: right-handed parallel beta-helix repeat-containing protein, partial [Planctomycetota bacterium]